MGKWWKKTTRRPGTFQWIWSVVVALVIMGLGVLYSDTAAALIPWSIAALLVVVVGELRALREHADDRWDDLHGPVKETLRVRGKEFDPDAKPRAVVTFAGREFRVDQVEHIMERGPIHTDFEATRGG